jgi:uncharacterized protein YqjF (DUF2071 family)
MADSSQPFLTAKWRNLLIVTYEVDPAAVIDRVPPGTTLDLWRGKALVSVVGFQFLDTKVLGAPIPFHQDFEEVNLRFYVRRGMDGEARPGVVFIREMVPRPIVGGMARLLYREPYLVVPMRSKVSPGPPPDVDYEWNAAGSSWCTLAARATGDAQALTAGSLEEFVTERHWGYNGEPGKDTLEYRVDHSRWRIWHVDAAQVSFHAEPLCGHELARELKAPISAILADGSAVTVHWRTTITG